MSRISLFVKEERSASQSPERALSPNTQIAYWHQESLDSAARDLKDKGFDAIEEKMSEIEERSKNKDYSNEMDEEMMAVYAAIGLPNVNSVDKSNIFFKLSKVLYDWAKWSKENNQEDCEERYGSAKEMSEFMLESLDVEAANSSAQGYVGLKKLVESSNAERKDGILKRRVDLMTQLAENYVESDDYQKAVDQYSKLLTEVFGKNLGDDVNDQIFYNVAVVMCKAYCFNSGVYGAYLEEAKKSLSEFKGDKYFEESQNLGNAIESFKENLANFGDNVAVNKFKQYLDQQTPGKSVKVDKATQVAVDAARDTQSSVYSNR